MAYKNLERLIELTIKIQQIAAPTFEEQTRAQFVLDLFKREGLQTAHIDSAGNVLACLPGTSGKPPLVVSAHLDTVFPFDTDLTITREKNILRGAGVGDNSAAVAALFGAIWEIQEHGLRFQNDIWFVANVCEEGLGDLKGMRAVVDTFGKDVCAYLVLEGMTYGGVYNQALGSKRYKAVCKTPGGHSWGAYGTPSAIHEMANLITNLLAIDFPNDPKASFNVGEISGGTSINTIAAEASILIDCRSVDQKTLQETTARIEKTIQQANKPSVSMEFEIIGSRPSGSLAEDHPLVEGARKSLLKLGEEAKLWIGSTDANIPLSMGIPAICIGLTKGRGAHTADEFIFLEHIPDGMTHIMDVIKAACS